MMGNTIFNRNNQNLANENLRAQYKLIEDSINKDNLNKDKIKDDFEKLTLAVAGVQNQNNRYTYTIAPRRAGALDHYSEGPMHGGGGAKTRGWLNEAHNC